MAPREVPLLSTQGALSRDYLRIKRYFQEECASEFDLRMHYGFTRTCVAECVSKHSSQCPVLPKAEECANQCHQRCAKENNVKCFAECLEAADCDGMESECIECIESCAATKVVIKETLDRGLFDVPTLKAHFTTHYLKVCPSDFTQKFSFTN